MSTIASTTLPLTVVAADAPARTKPSNYPAPYAAMMSGRIKRPLGDLFGLTSFGVNHVTMEAGAMSALMHRHSTSDEWIYVLSGELTLVHEDGDTVLKAGMCAGFKAGGIAHQLVNRSNAVAVYLEMGDRNDNDVASYPRDDLQAVRDGSTWRFVHKDGSPYDQ